MSFSPYEFTPYPGAEIPVAKSTPMIPIVTKIIILITLVFWGYGCAFFTRVVSGAAGIKVEKYSSIGVVDFEGQGGKEVAIALASAMAEMETKGKQHLKVKYIPLSRTSTQPKIKLKIFKGFDDKPRYKMLKEQAFEHSSQRFERRGMREAIVQGQNYGVEAIITGKMIFNDVMDAYIEKATDIHIMREAVVKFYVILIDATTGQIKGRAHDVWNKGFLFADRHIPKEDISLYEYAVEQVVERKLVKGLTTVTMTVGVVYDYLKDEFEPPDVMIKKARERVVHALIVGITNHTNY